MLDAATRALCDRVADQLEAEAEDLAETMTAGVFEEIPAYGPIATSDQRATVMVHSRDHVRAIVPAIRARGSVWSKSCRRPKSLALKNVGAHKASEGTA